MITISPRMPHRRCRPTHVAASRKRPRWRWALLRRYRARITHLSLACEQKRVVTTYTASPHGASVIHHVYQDASNMAYYHRHARYSAARTHAGQRALQYHYLIDTHYISPVAMPTSLLEMVIYFEAGTAPLSTTRRGSPPIWVLEAGCFIWSMASAGHHEGAGAAKKPPPTMARHAIILASSSSRAYRRCQGHDSPRQAFFDIADLADDAIRDIDLMPLRRADWRGD